MFNASIFDPVFAGIKSSSFNLESQSAMIRSTLYVISDIASSLLLFFFMVRIITEYLKYHLDSAKVLKSLYTSFFGFVIVWFLLHYYVEIFNLLDGIVHAIMKKIRLEDVLENTKEIQEALDGSSHTNDTNTEKDRSLIDMFLSSLKDLMLAFASRGIKIIAMITSSTMNILRTQLILFCVQVGPLAIAISLLPGDFSKVALYWFKMLLSFLAWGITMDIIDLSILSTASDGFDGLAASISSVTLYTMVGPLSSIFIGNTMGNSFFSIVLAGSNQMMSKSTSAGMMGLSKGGGALAKGVGGLGRGAVSLVKGVTGLGKGASGVGKGASALGKGASALGKGASGAGKGASGASRGAGVASRGAGGAGRGASGAGRGASELEKIRK